MKQHETRPDGREWRRRRAWALKQQGWKQKDIAKALGITPGAVSQWCTRAREGGVEALRCRRASGRPPSSHLSKSGMYLSSQDLAQKRGEVRNAGGTTGRAEDTTQERRKKKASLEEV